MTSPKAIFQEKLDHHKLEWSRLNKQYNFIAFGRIFIFLLYLVLAVYFANAKMGYGLGITAFSFPFVFGVFVKIHRRISYKRKQESILQKINEDELKIFNGDLRGQEDGANFKDKNHQYINDLDIFGSNSIFQLVNRSTTNGGRRKLAQWLSKFSKKEIIESRQKAVKELSPKIDWRQKFQASGLHHKNEKANPELLIKWINEPYIYNKAYNILAWALPIVTISAVILYFAADISFYYTLGMLTLNGIVLSRFSKHIQNLTLAVSDHINLLASYSALIKHLEDSTFESRLLQELRTNLSSDGKKASASIINLYRILDFLNARANFFYFLIDSLTLFDLHIMFMAERWKRKNIADVSLWFDSISEFEAICSLSALAYSNPEFSFPTISSEDYNLKGEDIAHPLIKKHERVSNSYALEGKGALSIITGSNMSGKSTFLRTLGVNIALALSGAPVCAKNFTVSELQVFTSMRTEDNLEEHVSSFYAELQRIKALLDEVEKGKPVLFMLDEILKGTNSHDRHNGAVSLAKQLSKTSSFGLISTHDLELGKLEKELNNVTNYSFNSEVKGTEIIFPYKLDDGICKSFNASALMEKMGIKMQ
ncbi:DNA mismatch repair protein MutS [Fulvivirga sp.]|uniref:MutS-related protein n=1 Tax=Fulvivirga sp. TaxID=1931237 RepID=UPI0032F00323